ncbi:hypothetical protein MXB_2198 [Myxobolus squamalis]|nr:hypothetical protein MXB_2198 [Myxobolus squamalis]
MMFIFTSFVLPNLDLRVGVFRYSYGKKLYQISNPSDFYVALQSFALITTIFACVSSFLLIFGLCIRSLKSFSLLYIRRNILGFYVLFFSPIVDEKSFNFDMRGFVNWTYLIFYMVLTSFALCSSFCPFALVSKQRTMRKFTLNPYSAINTA